MHLHKSDRPPQTATPPDSVVGPTMMIQRCTDCAKVLAPLTTMCSACHSSALDWIPSSGEGAIVLWRVMQRPSTGSYGEWETSTIAIVELDDGPWIYATIDGAVPPPSDQPVRVRFETQPTTDRFPVFTTRTADRQQSLGNGRSESRPANDPKRMTSRAPTTKGCHSYDSTWVRSWLHLCDFLEATESLDAEARSLISFAVRWAPFGGANAEELFVTCGVTRWRFVQMIRDALRPHPHDSRKARAFKRNLLDALSWAWRAYPDSSACHAPG